MFKSVLPLAFGLALAGSLSQFPEFSQQYTQRVGGAYDELKTVADGFRSDAANNGKTVEQAVAEYAATGVRFFQDRGESIAQVMTREAYLKRHYTKLTNGDGFDQLLVFVRERDNGIARDALGIYQPALPITFAGFAHAGLGFLAGYFLLRFPWMFRRRKRSAAG